MKSKGISLFCLFIFLFGCQKNSGVSKPPLGFPFEMVSAKTEKLDETSSYEFIDVIVAQESFSETNLDKLFRYFLQKYSEHNKLIVRAYVNKEKYQESLTVPKEDLYGSDIGINNYCDAIFYKIRENEWYMYSLDLEHSVSKNFNTGKGEKVKVVTIKGRL
jgi:hypothetical protein